MESPVNTALFFSPVNWIIVFLMLAFAMFIGEAFLQWFNPQLCGNNGSKNT